MSSSKVNTLVDVTNNDRKSTRNGGHANINLSEKAIQLRNNEQALALEQSARSRSRKQSSSVGGSKQPSKKQKRKSIHYNHCYLTSTHINFSRNCF